MRGEGLGDERTPELSDLGWWVGGGGQKRREGFQDGGIEGRETQQKRRLGGKRW